MTYANLTEKQKQFVDLAISEGHTEEITTKDIKELQTKYNNT